MGALDDLVRAVEGAESVLHTDPEAYLDAQEVLQSAVGTLTPTDAEDLLPSVRAALERIVKLALDDNSLQQLRHAASLTVNAVFRRSVQRPATRPKGVRDPTFHILRKAAKPAVPDLDALKEFLLTKPEGLSFPLSPASYANLEAYDCDGFFCEGTRDSYCLNLEYLLAFSVFDPPKVGSTEFSYIPFWNMLIHESVTRYLQGTVPCTFDRNTNYETQTLSQLPDYIGYLGAPFSLLRGEEKSPRGSGDPRQELKDKLVWVYKNLPYILGYYARGMNVTFGALYLEGTLVEFKDVVTLDLSNITDRVASQLILFNMGRVLAGLTDLCERTKEMSDTLPVQEADAALGGKSVVLSGFSVIKGYLDLEKAKKAWEAYQRIQGCPNAEECRTAIRPCKRRRQGDDSRLYALTFTPRVDTAQRARPLNELVRALLHVSNALCFAHSRNVMHRDVSWRNVGLDVATNQWVLLDWDDSCLSPAKSASPLSCACHAPEISLGPHSTAVDVWGLGWLIASSKIALTEELEKLREDCMKDPPARPKISACRKRLREIFSRMETGSSSNTSA